MASTSPRRRWSRRNHSTASEACQNGKRRGACRTHKHGLADNCRDKHIQRSSYSPVFLSDNEDDDIQSAICQKGSLYERTCSTVTPPLLSSGTHPCNSRGLQAFYEGRHVAHSQRPWVQQRGGGKRLRCGRRYFRIPSLGCIQIPIPVPVSFTVLGTGKTIISSGPVANHGGTHDSPLTH